VSDVDRQNLLAVVAHFETHSRRKLASLVDRANADPDIGFHLALKEEESPTIKAGGGIPAPVRPFITITAVPKPARRSIGSQLAGAPPVPEPQGPNIQISMTVAGRHPAGRAEAPAIGAALGAAAGALASYSRAGLRALRRLQRETTAKSVYIFVSERGAPLSVAGCQRMVARAGVAAKFPFLIHSHMLRHRTGYKLANDGQGHSGCRSSQRCLLQARGGTKPA
jgi:hypothetical protein